MPNRYEREIEEILRNLEHTEPKSGLGQKFSGRIRRKPGPSMRVREHHLFSFRLSTSEWLLTFAVIAALIGGGYAYFQGRADPFSTIVAIVGVICLFVVVLLPFMARTSRAQSTRYGNITVTPLRRSLVSSLKTRWNLWMLKMRYRRKNGR